jgi:hypothetical protein
MSRMGAERAECPVRVVSSVDSAGTPLSLRSANCGTGLDALGPSEELVMVAPCGVLIPLVATDSGGNIYVKGSVAGPCDGLILTASQGFPSVSAEIAATFLLRDFAT